MLNACTVHYNLGPALLEVATAKVVTGTAATRWIHKNLALLACCIPWVCANCKSSTIAWDPKECYISMHFNPMSKS